MRIKKLPEIVLFMGLPASGKSTFFEREFSKTHVRINLDMLRTRNREPGLLQTCLDIKQSCVVDNTNVSCAERSKYVEVAKENKFRVRLYCFISSVSQSLDRNALRDDPVPNVAIFAKQSQLEYPSVAEGFDEILFVRAKTLGVFEVERGRYAL